MDQEIYMRRALELAERGKGKVRPNPLVGCVIVHEGQVIGEGYHEYYGGPHAEVNALGSVSDQDLIGKSTLYVTLEPCAHWEKLPLVQISWWRKESNTWSLLPSTATLLYLEKGSKSSDQQEFLWSLGSWKMKLDSKTVGFFVKYSNNAPMWYSNGPKLTMAL